jgi:hypothetical protein
MMAKTLSEFGFVPTYADLDVWRRPATKANGDLYYEYLVVYLDDALKSFVRRLVKCIV